MKSSSRGAQRRDEIMAMAKRMFLDQGYDGTSMEALAERIGGSKETIYCHFGSKAGLLRAIIEDAATALLARFEGRGPSTCLESFLRDFADSYLDLILSADSLALYRLVIAESRRAPEIGDLFYRTCPEALRHRLAHYFARAGALGLLAIDDPDRAAGMFFGMLKADLQMRALFNPTRAPTEREKRAHARHAVDCMLRLFGSDAKSSSAPAASG